MLSTQFSPYQLLLAVRKGVKSLWTAMKSSKEKESSVTSKQRTRRKRPPKVEIPVTESTVPENSAVPVVKEPTRAQKNNDKDDDFA